MGVHILPRFSKDTTDRNRTSPVAFTGNKFEFRMPGSSLSISDINIVINTAVAEILRRYADRLEEAQDFNQELNALIKKELTNHQRIIFNGNGYGEEWMREAKERGLMNLPTLPDAVPYFESQESVDLFGRHRIFTPQELHARTEIFLTNYCHDLHIEVLTMIDMARKQIVPAGLKYIKELTELAVGKQKLGLPVGYECDTIQKLSARVELISNLANRLEELVQNVGHDEEHMKDAEYYRDQIIPAMK